MLSFADKLDRRVKEANTLLCVGLDPTSLTLQVAKESCFAIIESTKDYAACYKINAAYFEVWGSEGVDAIGIVSNYIPLEIPLILDCKRGDIHESSLAYAKAVYMNFPRVDCVTLSPYMGCDSILPFISGDFEGKGAFILCKTSNLSSDYLQNLRVLSTTDGSSSEYLFETVASMVDAVKSASIGIVCGATDTAALDLVRQRSTKRWILSPGIGAQGQHNIEAVVGAGLRRDDMSGLLISVSRGISQSTNMSKTACDLRDEINSCRKSLLAARSTASLDQKSTTITSTQREFIQYSLAQGALLFGSFTLKSCRQSPYFFNAGSFSTGDSIAKISR